MNMVKSPDFKFSTKLLKGEKWGTQTVFKKLYSMKLNACTTHKFCFGSRGSWVRIPPSRPFKPNKNKELQLTQHYSECAPKCHLNTLLRPSPQAVWGMDGGWISHV